MPTFGLVRRLQLSPRKRDQRPLRGGALPRANSVTTSVAHNLTLLNSITAFVANTLELSLATLILAEEHLEKPKGTLPT